MRVLDCFDHAFVINLPEDTERLAETQQELARHDIPFETLSGFQSRVHASLRKNAVLGALLAHLNAVEEAQRRNYKTVLIAEDDVVLRPNFRDLWKDVIPQMPGLSYDLFFFYNWMKPTPLVRPIQVHPIDTTLCAHFYAVHGSFYEKFKALVKAQVASNAPKSLDRLFHAPEVNSVATSYNLAGQRPAYSRLAFGSRKEICFGFPHPSL